MCELATATDLERHEPQAVRQQGRVPQGPLVGAGRPGAVVVRGADLRDGGDGEGLLLVKLFVWFWGREGGGVRWLGW